MRAFASDATAVDWRWLMPVGLASDGTTEGTDALTRSLPRAEGRSWITVFTLEAHRLSRLEQNWDSYGAAAPNQVAVVAAGDVLDVLWDAAVVPDRIAPLADGGLVLWLSGPRGEASVELLNSGEVFVETLDDDGRETFEEHRGDVVESVEKVLAAIGRPAPEDVPFAPSRGSGFSAG